MRVLSVRDVNFGNRYGCNFYACLIYRRATEEDVNFESDALDSLTQIGATCSLRYALNLIGPSSLAAARRKATVVAVEDVRTAFGLFADTQRSLQFIEEQQDLMMFGQKQLGSGVGGGVETGTGAAPATNGGDAMMTD